MNQNRNAFIIGLIISFASMAALADQQDAQAGSSNMLYSLLYSVLPVIIIVVPIFFFLKFILRKNQRRSDDYINMQAQHMQRVEQTLERIAKALETKDQEGSGKS